MTTGAFQTTNNGVTRGVSNAFVTKLNGNGSALVYSTYLGGSGAMNFMNSASTVGDGGSAIAVDSAGNAYVTGAVYSQDFPVTSGAFQKVNNAAGEYSDNVFISKINAAGSALIYSTYLGGSAQGFNFVGNCNINCYGDSGAAIALDANGNAYVAGTANSTDFPVTDGAFQKTNNDAPLEESTAFVAKLNATGSALVYSTYVGGSGTAMAGEPTVFGDLRLTGTGMRMLPAQRIPRIFQSRVLLFRLRTRAFLGSTRLFLLRSSTRPVRGWFSRPSWAGRGVTSRRASRWMVREKSF